MSSLSSVMPSTVHSGLRSDRIDRLEWAAGTCIDSYGVKVGVRSNEPRLLDLLVARLPPGWKPSRSPVVDRLFSVWVDLREEGARRPSRLYADGSRRARTRHLGELLATLESEISDAVSTIESEIDDALRGDDT